MNTLILEAQVIETKNHYTIDCTIENEWGMKKPIMKKVIYGVKIKKPTAYRIYKHQSGGSRTWVFGDLEINPCKGNLNKIAENI